MHLSHVASSHLTRYAMYLHSMLKRFLAHLSLQAVLHSIGVPAPSAEQCHQSFLCLDLYPCGALFTISKAIKLEFSFFDHPDVGVMAVPIQGLKPERCQQGVSWIRQAVAQALLGCLDTAFLKQLLPFIIWVGHCMVASDCSCVCCLWAVVIVVHAVDMGDILVHS